MKTVNLAPLLKLDKEYENACNTASENYKGAWDDSIHDSYMVLLKLMQENVRKIHVIRCKAETLNKETEGLKVEELKRLSDNLCREADSV